MEKGEEYASNVDLYISSLYKRKRVGVIFIEMPKTECVLDTMWALVIGFALDVLSKVAAGRAGSNEKGNKRTYPGQGILGYHDILISIVALLNT